MSFVKDEKEIFTTHPVERKQVIFQLGSANAAWAYEAIKFVTAHDDVAGVDLNCGCPKPFSTIGGMGAHLLTTPDILCDVLRAMRRAAPPHVSVSCKIRLLPSREETQALVRQILRLGIIDNLTVHCRTKEMRPREPALLDRLREVVEIVREETGGKLPLCCNGDAWDWNEAKRIMEMTGESSMHVGGACRSMSLMAHTAGVTSVMIARGAEANPSCFEPRGVSSIADEVAPQYVRYVSTTATSVASALVLHSTTGGLLQQQLRQQQVLHDAVYAQALVQLCAARASAAQCAEQEAAVGCAAGHGACKDDRGDGAGVWRGCGGGASDKGRGDSRARKEGIGGERGGRVEA